MLYQRLNTKNLSKQTGTRNSKSGVVARRRRGSVRVVHDDEGNEANAPLFGFRDDKIPKFCNQHLLLRIRVLGHIHTP